MKPAPWLWWAAGVLALGYIAALAFLPRRALAPSSGEMPTVAAKKHGARLATLVRADGFAARLHDADRPLRRVHA